MLFRSASRVLTFRDGRLTRDEGVAEPLDAAARLATLPAESAPEEAVA